MSATVAHTPNFLIRRIVAVTVLALVVAAVVAAAVQASQPKVHAQVLKGGTVQVSGYDGGAAVTGGTH